MPATLPTTSFATTILTAMLSGSLPKTFRSKLAIQELLPSPPCPMYQC
ncbi:unnamed protein product [Rhizoctonia solani]|uniref:Uncharacterized protein n=1 Tax=Rhizoctonia solani TaxID=456999 RepID=A0A8H3HRY5_9AGAM|nr:unnamed protein product [Rhizoctonia solani]